MYHALNDIPAYKTLRQKLSEGAGAFLLCGTQASQKSVLAADLGAAYGWKLYVCRDEKTAAESYADLRSLGEPVFLYPARDLLFADADVQGGYIERERLTALRHLAEDPRGVLVTTMDGLLEKIPVRETLLGEVLELSEAMVTEPPTLSSSFARMGYERVAQVSLPGQFAVRGGIVDIYPVTQENPLRIEFFGDEVDTIRSFDPESQRSMDRLRSARVYPAAENTVSQGSLEKGTLFSYFRKDALFFLEEPMRLWERADALSAELLENQRLRKEKGLQTSEESSVQTLSAAELAAELKERRVLFLNALDETKIPLPVRECFSFQVNAVGVYRRSFELLVSELRRLVGDGYRISILTPSRTRTGRLAETLREQGLKAYVPDEGREQALCPGEIEVVCGSLRHGFSYPESRYALFTETDLFGTSQSGTRRRRKKQYEGTRIADLHELHIGDYVVHESHGIGIYRGLEHIEQDGVAKDYIKLEYADGGNLYLPATRLELLQKYAGAEAKAPRLNRLGGTEWTKTRQRVTRSVAELARELVELYAKRNGGSGYRCEPDTVWQKEFEELFPYEETEDQLRAIEAVKADMESTKIMDRLICGDVGFGKTEIAVRAAFKEVQEGRQVAYLVPTTILAKQHFDTFSERMQNYPVHIEMMSRFRSPAENKKTAEGLRTGAVDIVIGTHRMLSADVSFRKLGLLIIDEEQRFGVRHKEKIKQLKTDVDVLTLSATPIPRTLHMSLAGIRDLSILEEPPVDRLPIQTYVMEYNEELVREAAAREIKRGGQVFYVYNRVKGIEEKTERLRALLPDARIACAHGQMDETLLEEMMLRFVGGQIDILVSTTIIETGLDIPNANTLIVDGAERMGLSQLYQIRGRVGRSNRTAYAFLMYRRGRELSEEAEKRLQAIREFTALGSGIRIAMRDLEIRGAGNVLGAEQHGQMEAVGYDLYCKLLRTAVRKLKGEPEEEQGFETSVDCEMDAYIPAEYVPNESQKLDLYKKISGISSDEDCIEVEDELLDRFGEMPGPLVNLLRIARLKAKAHRAYVVELAIGKNSYRMTMFEKAEVHTEGIPAYIAAEHGKLRYLRGQSPKFVYEDKTPHPDCERMLEKAEEFLEILLGKEAGCR